MTEVLLFVNIGLLVIGSVTLTIAVFVLQKARGYVDLAEERMERLREGQDLVFQFLREEKISRIERNEAVAREESLVPEVRHQGEEHHPEPKIEELENELQKLRQGRGDNLMEQSGPSWSGNSSEEPPQNVGLLAEEKEESEVTQENPKSSSAAKPPGPTSPGSGPSLAVKHAHPDDDISLRREGVKGVKQDDSQGGAPVKMFREHYRRYLENYEGYVKLAERLCRMRVDGEVPPGSPAEDEWKQKLRRLNDGIQRTTTRLDILEQYNPELASDDRVSDRAEIARSYAELQKKLPAPENS